MHGMCGVQRELDLPFHPVLPGTELMAVRLGSKRLSSELFYQSHKLLKMITPEYELCKITVLKTQDNEYTLVTND